MEAVQPDTVFTLPAVDLHIGANEVIVTRVMGGTVDVQMVLKLGTAKTANDFFRHSPPTPLEMENAIMAVEDEVMLARDLAAQPCNLRSADGSIREIALLAGVSAAHSMQLSVEQVERQFDLLAALVLGRPASSAGIPADSNFAATLLVLREFMHHLKFAHIFIELPGEAETSSS